jgi:pyrophosphatase PpaX
MPAPRRPLALLFDLDGTLVDSIELILQSFRHTFAMHLGDVPPDAKWIAGLGTPLFTQLREFTLDDAIARAMTATYRAYQMEHHDELMRAYAGAREALTELRANAHPTAIVTSKMSDLAERALRFTGLRDAIDVVVGMENTKRHKPDPEPVRLALDALGYQPREAIMLGDSPHDIAAGNAAGVVTVAAQWGPFTRAELDAAHPAYQAARIRDFPAMVARIGGEAR